MHSNEAARAARLIAPLAPLYRNFNCLSVHHFAILATTRLLANQRPCVPSRADCSKDYGKLFRFGPLGIRSHLRLFMELARINASRSSNFDSNFFVFDSTRPFRGRDKRDAEEQHDLQGI